MNEDKEITIELGSGGKYWVFKGEKPKHISGDKEAALRRANEFLAKEGFYKGKTWEV